MYNRSTPSMEKLVKDGKRINFHIYPFLVDDSFLKHHENDVIFVFGDNSCRCGHGGAAKLRDSPNAWGFITKRYPSYADTAYFNPDNYLLTFIDEQKRLVKLIEDNKEKWILISKLGGGLGNRYKIFDIMIGPWLETLKEYENVILLYEKPEKPKEDFY